MDYDLNLLGMDELTAQLIIQLQMEDVEELKASSKGKNRAGQKTDAQLALELYEKDLEGDEIFLSDRLMTRSIAHAVHTDGEILAGTFQFDLTARDHLAVRSGSIPDFPTEAYDPPTGEAQIMTDDVFEKLAAKYAGYNESNGLDHELIAQMQKECMEAGESSAWAGTRRRFNPTRTGSKPRPAVVKRPCISCGDDMKFFDLARVPCGHEYCRTCLQELFQNAMTDESLFPPRCCRQHITLGSVRMWLKTDLALSFYKKKIELDTPNRTYCSNKTCLLFIHPDNISNDLAICPKCATRTCSICKSATHAGDCPNDVALQQVLQVAEANSWKRCYSCKRVVELAMGCNHITCRCAAQFCYICGEIWKRCHCELWDEARLLARANNLVDRRPPQAIPVGVAGPAVQVQVPGARGRHAHYLGYEAVPAAPPNPRQAAAPIAEVFFQQIAAPVRQAPAPEVHDQPRTRINPPRQQLPPRPVVEPRVPRPAAISGSSSFGVLNNAQTLAARPLQERTSLPTTKSEPTAPVKVASVQPPSAQPCPQSDANKTVPKSTSSSTSNASRLKTPGSPSTTSPLPNLLPEVIGKDTGQTTAAPSSLAQGTSQLRSQSELFPRGATAPRAQSSVGTTLPTTKDASGQGSDEQAPTIPTSKSSGTESAVAKKSTSVKPNPTKNFIRQDVGDSQVEKKNTIRINGDRAKLVADAMQRLVENHECEHLKWKFVPGAHQCEECNKNLPKYIFECLQCEVQACNRCRRNRL